MLNPLSTITRVTGLFLKTLEMEIGRLWPSTPTYFSLSMKEMVVKQATLSGGPICLDNPKGQRALLTTSLALSTSTKHHTCLGASRSFLVVPANYILFGTVLVSWLLGLLIQYYFLGTCLGFLRGSYIYRVWT